MSSTTTLTMADALTPAEWRRSTAARVLTDLTLVLAGSLVVALTARVVVPLPFTPVPITGQPFGVLLVAAALGSRRGALTMIAYLLEGAAGLPVFAGGGATIAWLLGPTAGYLWSYPAAAWVTGRLTERGWGHRPPGAALAFLAGTAVIYAVGVPWLAMFVGAENVLMAGLWPFLPGDLVKIALAAVLLPGAWRVVAFLGGRPDAEDDTEDDTGD